MAADSAAITPEELEAWCAGWPGVTRSIKWDVDLVMSVANKMFAVLCTLGPERGRLSFKVDPDRFLTWTDRDGVMPAPYMARAFWISVIDPATFDPAELREAVQRSYVLVSERLPKKVRPPGRFTSARTHDAEPASASAPVAKRLAKTKAATKTAPARTMPTADISAATKKTAVPRRRPVRPKPLG